MAETVTSDSVGEPARFLAFDELCRRLDTLPPAPKDRGRVALIVRRRELGRREDPPRVRLTPEEGMPGDAWIRRGTPDPAAQIAVIQMDVARLIANGQPLELFGDNLYLELDLSSENLQAGARLQLGGATVEVTPKPHNGCGKFQKRFGSDAHRFVLDSDRRHRNLRGIYLRVLEAGDVAVGDAVEVVWRADRIDG